MAVALVACDLVFAAREGYLLIVYFDVSIFVVLSHLLYYLWKGRNP